MKRFIALILAILTILSFAFPLAGCNSQQVHIYTRGEWISEVANVFGLNTPYSEEPYFDDVKGNDEYFNSVQACAEWEIIDKGGNFNPDKRADVNFAMVTAVKAVGLDRIAQSVDGRELKTEKDIIQYFNEHSNVKYISGSSLYMDTAAEILADVERIHNDMVLKQSQNIDYVDNVVTIKESNVRFSMDGETAELIDIDPAVGSVLVLEPSSNYPYGRYAKIVAKEGKKITYTQPTFEEMFDKISIVGTYEAVALGFIPANDGVTVKSIGGVEAVPQNSYIGKDGKVENSTIYVQNLTSANQGLTATPLGSANLGDIELELSVPITNKEGEKIGKVGGGVTLKDIVATADIDLWGPIVQKADIKLDTTVEVSAFAELEKEFEKFIPLGKIPFKLWGIVGFDVEVGIKAGIEGGVSVVFSFDATTGVTYKPFATPKYTLSAKNPNLDIEIKAKAYVKPEIKATFVVACFDVANVGINGGLEASAVLKLGTSDDSGCVDINAYLAAGFYVGAEKKETLLGKLNIKYKKDIWDKDNSPLRKNFHIEDFQLVPECTKKDKEDPEHGGDGTTFEDIFEHIPTIDDLISSILQENGHLELSTYYAKLEEGESDRLLTIGLPEGYSLSDLRFSSSNPEIATVSGTGSVKAVSSGSCIIKVETTDAMYSQCCVVTVLASYDVEFTPLSVTNGGVVYATV